MRPDVAAAFDRMARRRAARRRRRCIITSAFRTDAEQAVLFAAHPDPKWVAPPGTSLHRLATELDLGPPAAYGWLAANAPRFGFVQRYSWEPWHFGYVRNAGTSAVGYGGGGDGDGARGAAVLRARAVRAAIARAAQRWNVSAALLAAQLYAESRTSTRSRVRRAGRRGSRSSCPARRAPTGSTTRSTPSASIDAQAHLMRDLLRQFASVPLALAAYNAGPARSRRAAASRPIPETRAYVARILGLLGGAGDIGLTDAGLAVRLVR